MSVDHYSCDSCGESIYSEYVGHCSECGHRLCSFCLINDDIDSKYIYDYGVRYNGSEEQKEKYGIKEDWLVKGYVTVGEPIDDVGFDSKYCPFCNGEKIHDEDLLQYLLSKYNINIEELKEEYLKNRNRI